MDGWMDRSLLPRYELSPVASIYFTYHYTRIFTGKKKRIKWYFIQIHLISPPPLKISWKYKGEGESNKIVERNTTRMTLCLYSSIYIFQSFVVSLKRGKIYVKYYYAISFQWCNKSYFTKRNNYANETKKMLKIISGEIGFSLKNDWKIYLKW